MCFPKGDIHISKIPRLRRVPPLCFPEGNIRFPTNFRLRRVRWPVEFIRKPSLSRQICSNGRDGFLKVGSPSADSILERFFRTVKSTDYLRSLHPNSMNNIPKMMQNDCLSFRHHNILLQNASFASGFHWILALKTQI